jgi:(2R)-3-sulfolactate dehydrogenase (NADP+)
MAAATARDLLLGEMLGQPGHGLFRVPQYSDFLRCGRAIGSAVARVVSERGGAVNIDAGGGLAFPALDLAVEQGVQKARMFGIAMISISRSHHAGALNLPVERAAAQGMIAIAMTNSPPAIAAPNGKKALLGTNPIAAAFPRDNGAPLSIDMALSTVARSRVIIAAKSGTNIPLGWSVDADGVPTTDPKAGLAGSMTAIGGVKGALLAVLVELLCSGLSGSRLSFEVNPFDDPEGNHPMLGQALIVLDPEAFGGREICVSRTEDLISAMLADPAVRLPGERRKLVMENARKDGLDIGPALLAKLEGAPLSSAS